MLCLIFAAVHVRCLPRLLSSALSFLILQSVLAKGGHLYHAAFPGLRCCGSFCLSPFLASTQNRRTMQPRFCVLMAGHASEYVQKAYGGLGSLFVKFLSDPGETWDLFSVIDAHFPPDHELQNYDGFVVTGSRHDAHGSEAWVQQLRQLIRKIYALQKKLLGICFGHQVICHALGGRTARSSIGWEVGLRKISISEALQAKPYGLQLPSSVNIIEIHQDQVFEMPPGGEILASSEKTGIEIFAIKEHVLGIQGHPEYTEDVLFNILEICWCLGMMTEDLVNQAKASIKGMDPYREILQQVCKTFLKENTSTITNHNCDDFQESLSLVLERLM